MQICRRADCLFPIVSTGRLIRAENPDRREIDFYAGQLALTILRRESIVSRAAPREKKKNASGCFADSVFLLYGY